MEKNKQIDEIAKDIYDTGVAIDGVDLAFGLFDNDDHFHRIAKELYSKGYRKQSDTVREFVQKLKQKAKDNSNFDNVDNLVELIKISDELAKEYGVQEGEQ